MLHKGIFLFFLKKKKEEEETKIQLEGEKWKINFDDKKENNNKEFTFVLVFFQDGFLIWVRG